MMNGVSSIVVSALALCLLFAHEAEAKVKCDPTQPVVYETIQVGDFRELVDCLENFERTLPQHLEGRWWIGEPIGRVKFDSVGGDVNEAMKIGRFLREGLADVIIENRCFSACFLAVAGAVEIWWTEGQMGIHRVFHDPAALKKLEIRDYERHYNRLKGEVRDYLQDLDVPIPLIEKMFSVPSDELYMITGDDFRLMRSNPAYEEWIAAHCPDQLTKAERSDYQSYVSSGFQVGPFSEGYVSYLSKLADKHETCGRDTRWKAFQKAISRHSL